MSSSDFQTILKNLGKQAKQAAEQRAAEEARQAQLAAEQFDFVKEMHDVQPLKNSHRYAPPRDTSPITPRVQAEQE